MEDCHIYTRTWALKYGFLTLILDDVTIYNRINEKKNQKPSMNSKRKRGLL